MLVKGKKGIQAMEHSSEASGSQSLLKTQGVITLAELIHISCQQVHGSSFLEAGCPQQQHVDCVCQASGNLLRQRLGAQVQILKLNI